MYFDRRLWGFTRGVRLRIFGAVALGVLAVLLGIARLALLGWLIAQVFSGTTLSDLLADCRGGAGDDRPRRFGVLANDGGAQHGSDRAASPAHGDF